MNIREKAQELIELAVKTTPGEWFAGDRTHRCHIEHVHGVGDCVYDPVFIPSDDWFDTTDPNSEIWERDYDSATLRNPSDARFIVAAHSHAPDIARKLIEAEKILIEMDRYLDFSTPYDDSVCETCGNGFPDASGINRAMQDAREFLNSLEKEDTNDAQ